MRRPLDAAVSSAALRDLFATSAAEVMAHATQGLLINVLKRLVAMFCALVDFAGGGASAAARRVGGGTAACDPPDVREALASVAADKTRAKNATAAAREV